MGAGSYWPGTWGPSGWLHNISARLKYVRTNQCLSQFHECLGYRTLGSLGFHGDTFHDMNLPSNEAIVLSIGLA